MEGQGEQNGVKHEEWWQKHLREKGEREEAREAAERAAKEKRRCPYVMMSGKQCGCTAQEGHKYCWSHEQYRRRVYRGDFFVPLLEDEATIRLTVSHALQAMMNGKVTPQMAKTVISGCAVALSALRGERAEQRRQRMEAEEAGHPEPETMGSDAVRLGETGIPGLKDEEERAQERDMVVDPGEKVEMVEPPEPALEDADYALRAEPDGPAHPVRFEPEPVAVFPGDVEGWDLKRGMMLPPSAPETRASALPFNPECPPSWNNERMKDWGREAIAAWLRAMSPTVKESDVREFVRAMWDVRRAEERAGWPWTDDGAPREDCIFRTMSEEEIAAWYRAEIPEMTEQQARDRAADRVSRLEEGE
jgi:hypothetical protein